MFHSTFYCSISKSRFLNLGKNKIDVKFVKVKFVPKKNMASATKGEKRELRTFLSWEKESVIGYKTEEIDGKTMVNFIWCKLCVCHKSSLSKNLKGQAKISVIYEWDQCCY